MENKKILVLCTGNSCRSQIAEGYLKFFLKNRANVYSAGVDNHEINKLAIKTMKDDGIDISKFNKGIMLDSTSQYVLVAIKDNIDFQKIDESITNAGYDLHHLCYIDNGLVKRINFNT